MKCPHCNKTCRVPDAVATHAENYGGGTYHVVTRCCGKAVQVRTARRVVVELLGKGDEKETEYWR